MIFRERNERKRVFREREFLVKMEGEMEGKEVFILPLNTLARLYSFTRETIRFTKSFDPRFIKT
jgi:hypothetical protein